MEKKTVEEEKWTLKQEFEIKSPSEIELKDLETSVLCFRNLNVGADLLKEGVKMVRENASKKHNDIDEMPEFGEGSEFGRKERMEARRRRFTRKVSENSPWLMKAGSKRFRGTFEPGVSSSASFYVFFHDTEGVFQAVPLSAWYNFSSHRRFKTMTAEEAEEKYVKREKILNFFQLKSMVKKEDNGDGEEGDSKGSSRWNSGLKVLLSEDDASEDEDSKAKAKGKKKGKKGKNDFDDDRRNEAFDDSDDGDIESKELEYMSDSSNSSLEAPAQLVAVGDELKTSSSEDEEETQNAENSQDGAKPEEAVEVKKEVGSDSEGSDLDLDNTDVDIKLNTMVMNSKRLLLNDVKEEKPGQSSKNSQSTITATSSSDTKVKFKVEGVGGPSMPKKCKPSSKESDEKSIEEEIKRYLMRKPILVNELVKKLRKKFPNHDLVKIVTNILNKLGSIPHFCKQKINGQWYFSITKS